MNEYEKPQLGSDSDDERRLGQAEARAVKKIKASKPFPNFHPYKRSSYSLASNTTGSEGQQKFETAWGAPATDPVLTQQPFRGQRNNPSQVVCYSCGQRGHFRSECRASNK